MFLFTLNFIDLARLPHRNGTRPVLDWYTSFAPDRQPASCNSISDFLVNLTIVIRPTPILNLPHDTRHVTRYLFTKWYESYHMNHIFIDLFWAWQSFLVLNVHWQAFSSNQRTDIWSSSRLSKVFKWVIWYESYLQSKMTHHCSLRGTEELCLRIYWHWLLFAVSLWT